MKQHFSAVLAACLLAASGAAQAGPAEDRDDITLQVIEDIDLDRQERGVRYLELPRPDAGKARHEERKDARERRGEDRKGHERGEHAKRDKDRERDGRHDDRDQRQDDRDDYQDDRDDHDEERNDQMEESGGLDSDHDGLPDASDHDDDER